jgi:hypothetical protein
MPPREVGTAPTCCCTCGACPKKGAPISLACVAFSILGLFSFWKPGGPPENSPEGDPPFMEAACSAARDDIREWNAGADKDASLSAIAAAVLLDSSPPTALTVGGSEVAGFSGCGLGGVDLTPEPCIIAAVCSGGAIMRGLELDCVPLVARALPSCCLSWMARSASARATCIDN